MVIAKDKISTGSQIFDELLCGGLERGIITTLFGAPGAGKSNLAMLFAANLAEQGKKIIFIDTESSFSSERVKQLKNQATSQLFKNILIFEPSSFEEQCKLFANLKKIALLEKPAAIIVDSIIMLYRLELGAEKEISEINRELANQMAVLLDIARSQNIPVLVTDHIYKEFDTKEIKIAGGDLIRYWSKCMIYLERCENAHRAIIWKHRSIKTGKEIWFEIQNNGLFEAKNPKKKFSLF
ncbi:MAG: DNA repair and recombination protein RadB [Candidatus Nanoarchaeia archaeon]